LQNSGLMKEQQFQISNCSSLTLYTAESNMKARFQRLGRALKHLPPSKDELLKILEEAVSCLVTIEQDDYGSMLFVRDSLVMQLAKHELLDHENGEIIMGDEPKREEKSDLQVCMDKPNEDSQEVTNDHYLVVTNATWIDNECKDERMNDRKGEEAFPSTLDHSQFAGLYAIVVHMQRKIVKEEQPRSLLSDQTQASKGQPRVDLDMALKRSISPYLPPHKKQPLNSYIEVINSSKCDLARTNDRVVDEHVHKKKSNLKDTIHLHHEPFEGQKGSMTLMVTPSHFLHDTSIGEGEKRGLDEENDEGKSAVLNSEILSFVDVGGSPRYDFSCLFPPYLLSFDEYEYEHEHVRWMDKRYFGHTIVDVFAPNTWVHKCQHGKRKGMPKTPTNENHDSKLAGLCITAVIREQIRVFSLLESSSKEAPCTCQVKVHNYK
ncbi:hypothetical protein KI387_015287, partial [Taxus chinensis]